ncbi:MAG: hypothetical protein HOP19_04510 [Acidobacteria bacterium]|nr:hypothetical protein [Acidobacteriota bacterium]
MWKQFSDLVWRVFRLTEDTQKNRADIHELQADVGKLSKRQDEEAQAWRSAIERLAYEFKLAHQREQHERETLALRMEIERLKAERTLPPVSGNPKPEIIEPPSEKTPDDDKPV